MSKSEFKVAIVGYGLAGAVFHAPLIKTCPGLKVAAIVTRSAEKQANAKRDFPDAEIFSDFEQLVSRAADFDLAVIATPNREHAPQAISLMKAGLNVVIDKPVALNSAECRKLIECRDRSGVLLSVFQNRRWDNDFLTIKKLIEDGKFGKILRVESRFERYRPVSRKGAWREQLSADEGGGILFDLGSHLIDQMTQLFGRPERVYSEINARREGVNADDDCFVALSFSGGAHAHLWMSAISSSLGHRFRVLGTEAAYEKYGLDPQEDALRAGGTPLDAGWGTESEEHWGKLTSYDESLNKAESRYQTVPGTYQQYYAQICAAMKKEGPLPVTVEEALSNLEIIEQCRDLACSAVR